MVSWQSARQRAEDREECFSPFAAKSRLSRGRMKPEAPCPVRTAFQRDRDRIIHSKSFRRLKHKTQVFIAPLGDHYVTRLTHTLEVAQIARTISRALNLNEDLTEAIALAHDLGHTPFGHVGEETLEDLSPHGFRHNEQSLRIVDMLEKDGKGLNLTWEVRDGILSHSKNQADIQGIGAGQPGTLEGQVCKLADAIAYINHDIGDAARAGIITERDLPLAAVKVLGSEHSARINAMVCDIVAASWAATGYNEALMPTIGMSPRILEATNTLRGFLFSRIYKPQSAQKEAERARLALRELYHFYTTHPEKLPPEYPGFHDELDRRVLDYIAGMTDQFATATAQGLGLIK